MVHDLAVWTHAVAATVALLAGVRTLPAGRGYPVYRGALVVAVLALVPALATGWAGTDPGLRAVFLGLLGLGAVVVARGVRAGAVLPGADGPVAAWRHRVGFTLVALVDGFLVVTALRLGAPGWALLAVGAGVAAAGHLAVVTGARRAGRRVGVLA